MRERAGRALVAAVVAGLIVGALTQLGQRLLPDAVQPVANSISPWLSLSFAVGAVSRGPRLAALGGWLSLVFALVGYYVLVEVQFGYGASTSSLVLWGAASLLGGLVFGPAGWLWRNGSSVQRAIAAGLLAAAFVAEAAYLFVVLQPEAKPASALFLVIGLALPMFLGRSWSQRRLAYLAVVPSLGLAVLGYVCLLAFGSIAAGI